MRRAQRLPSVQAAQLAAAAAWQAVRAARAEALPKVSASIQAGKYGIVQRDFDYRLLITASVNLSAIRGDRVRQAEARAELAEASAQTARIEAMRDAEVAWSDVKAREEA